MQKFTSVKLAAAAANLTQLQPDYQAMLQHQAVCDAA